jgi:lipoprotein-anchoring transpeptidase ErfK/SrfK
MHRITPIATLVAALLLFSACTNGGDQASIDSGIVVDPIASEGSGNQSDGAATLNDVPTSKYIDSSTRAIVTSGDLDVLATPGGEVTTTLSATTDFGTTRVLLVEEVSGDWAKVRLPSRPNHRAGWVSLADVELESLELEVYIDLATKTLTVRNGDELLVRSSIAIGSDENPTPTGTFYVTDKLETPNPEGGYGPYAFGLSGYSETLTEFAGGDGQIGIHGTNDPTSIGNAVSHGCIRLPNDIVESLATMVPLGTPVHVV